jgi:hypothetical protein
MRSEDVTNAFDLEMLAILEVSRAFQTAMEEFRPWCISFERHLGRQSKTTRPANISSRQR